MIGKDLTQAQVKRLFEIDVKKNCKRCEASLSSKTCNALVDTFFQLSCEAFTHFLHESKLPKDLNENFVARWKLGTIAGRFSLNYETFSWRERIAWLRTW